MTRGSNRIREATGGYSTRPIHPSSLIGTFRLAVAGKPDVALTCHEIVGIDVATKTINIVMNSQTP